MASALHLNNCLRGSPSFGICTNALLLIALPITGPLFLPSLQQLSPILISFLGAMACLLQKDFVKSYLFRPMSNRRKQCNTTFCHRNATCDTGSYTQMAQTLLPCYPRLTLSRTAVYQYSHRSRLDCQFPASGASSCCPISWVRWHDITQLVGSLLCKADKKET